MARTGDELSEEVHRINRLDLPGLALTSVGPIRDCSGLRVTVGVRDDLARASREIQSRMRLEFGVEPPGQLMPAGHHRRARLVPRTSQAGVLYGAGGELADLVTRCRQRRRDSPLGR